jgi:hypothetical protein
MKKLFALVAAMCVSASAMADWTLTEQTEDSYTFDETTLGVRMVAGKLGASGSADLAEVAAGIAQAKGCEAPAAVEFKGKPAQHIVCPNNVQGFVVDDGDDILMIAGACDSQEKCAAIDTLLDQVLGK